MSGQIPYDLGFLFGLGAASGVAAWLLMLTTAKWLYLRAVALWKVWRR